MRADSTLPALSITVEIRDVYGRPAVYPVCEKAKLFAAIAGTKTLKHDTLCVIERLGYLIVSTANTDWRTAR